MLFCPLHLPLALLEDAEFEVGLWVLRVQSQYSVVGFGSPGFVSQGQPGLPEGYEVPDLISPPRHAPLREPQGLGQILPQGEQMGGQFVPDLRRARTVFEAPPEGRLGLLQAAVARVGRGRASCSLTRGEPGQSSRPRLKAASAFCRSPLRAWQIPRFAWASHQ